MALLLRSRQSLVALCVPVITSQASALLPVLTGFASPSCAVTKRLHDTAVTISAPAAASNMIDASPDVLSPSLVVRGALPVFSEDEYKFAAFANWLVRGSLMIGRYPGVEPSRCSTAACAEEHIESLINAGIGTWVGFQAEVPSQELAIATPHTALAPNKHGMSKLLVSEASLETLAVPCNMQDAENTHRTSVTHATIAGQEDGRPKEWIAVSAEEWQTSSGSVEPNAFFEGGRCGDFGAYGPTAARIAAKNRRPAPRFLHFPIMDLQAPTLAGLQEMASTVHAAVKRHEATDGGAVYLHCWGGKGRSGTVGAALLARESAPRGLTAS